MRYKGKSYFSWLAAQHFEGVPGGVGQTYYVDGVSGADTQSGLYPSQPKKTLLATLALCTTQRHDYIFVLNHYQETMPIVVGKSCVHIIGISTPNSPWPYLNASTDAAVFRCEEASLNCEIAGFNIGGGTSYEGIWMVDAQGYWIHDNWFGNEQVGDTPLYGIRIQYNPHGTLIENNRFFGNLGSSRGTITGSGIYRVTAGGDNHAAEIRHNIFDGLSYGINLTAADGYIIEKNRFSCPNAQNGEAINLDSACTDTMVVNNLAVYGMLSNGWSYNPYRDLATNTVNNWGRNYRNNAIVEPMGV